MDLKIYFQTKDLDIYQLYIPPSFEATAKKGFDGDRTVIYFNIQLNRKLEQDKNNN